jgi:hypothetical protein
MADARAMELPLVTTGDPDFVEHDFHAIFSSLGVLEYDTRIAAAVRLIGWCGMIACVAWLALRVRANNEMRVAPLATAFPKPFVPLIQRYPGKPSTTAVPSVDNAVAVENAKAGKSNVVAAPTGSSPQ